MIDPTLHHAPFPIHHAPPIPWSHLTRAMHSGWPSRSVLWLRTIRFSGWFLFTSLLDRMAVAVVSYLEVL